MTADVFFFDDCEDETVLDDDAGLEDDTDLDELELELGPVPVLLVCAKALDWNAVSANPSNTTAIVVLSVFMIKKIFRLIDVIILRQCAESVFVFPPIIKNVSNFVSLA